MPSIIDSYVFISTSNWNEFWNREFLEYFTKAYTGKTETLEQDVLKWQRMKDSQRFPYDAVYIWVESTNFFAIGIRMSLRQREDSGSIWES